MQKSMMFAVLAAVLLVAGVAGTTNNAYAYKTEYGENGRTLNGHEIPAGTSPKVHAFSEVFTCTWYRADDDPRCDLSWIPAEIIDWLRHTNSYTEGNLYILNE